MKQPIAIYKTGSSCILDTSNDKDLVYFYATKEEAREALIKYRHTEKENIHFAPIDSVQKVFLGCYILPYMVKVSGDDIDLSFNFLQHREEYIELLRKFVDLRKKDGAKAPPCKRILFYPLGGRPVAVGCAVVLGGVHCADLVNIFAAFCRRVNIGRACHGDVAVGAFTRCLGGDLVLVGALNAVPAQFYAVGYLCRRKLWLTDEGKAFYLGIHALCTVEHRLNLHAVERAGLGA